MTDAEAPKRPNNNDPRRRKQSEHFFARESDGTVRLRIRFDSAEASLMEEAAGEVPLMAWIHQTLAAASRKQVEEIHRNRPNVGPPDAL
jgi:hypothetical protein